MKIKEVLKNSWFSIDLQLNEDQAFMWKEIDLQEWEEFIVKFVSPTRLNGDKWTLVLSSFHTNLTWDGYITKHEI